MLMMIRRLCVYSDINPNQQKYDSWISCKKYSETLRAIDVEHFVTIVKRHMIPTPSNDSSSGDGTTQDLFYYVSH